MEHPTLTWPFGHNNKTQQGQLETRKGKGFDVEAFLRYHPHTDTISWGIENGLHPDWLDTISQMKTVLRHNNVRLTHITILNKKRYRFICTKTGRFLRYSDKDGKTFILGTPDNNWLFVTDNINNIPHSGVPENVQSIPLDVLCKMLLPLESYLMSEYNIH